MKKHLGLIKFKIMKKYLFLLILFLSFSNSAQDTYLHCGKIIDTENGKILTNKKS